MVCEDELQKLKKLEQTEKGITIDTNTNMLCDVCTYMYMYNLLLTLVATRDNIGAATPMCTYHTVLSSGGSLASISLGT